MANEKRLIDAKPLMQNGWHLVRTGESNKFLSSMSLADVPAVDAVVLPCEIGREVFYIWSVIDDNGVENFTISIGKIVSFSIQKDGIWAYCRYEDGLTYWHKVIDDFGGVVFLTREEAEKALAKMDGDGNV